MTYSNPAPSPIVHLQSPLARRASVLVALVSFGCGDGPDLQGPHGSNRHGGAATRALALANEAPGTIPGRVEAESYLGFFETTGANHGAEASPECDRGDGVDAERTTDPAGGGCNIGWTAPGEWLEYQVSVAEPGRFFDITARVASDFDGKTLRIDLDGNPQGLLQVPNAGWQAFEDRKLSSVWIDQGQHLLRVSFDLGEVNLNFLEFEATLPQLPTRLEAEHYTRRSESTPTNQGAADSPECDRGDGVDLETTGDLAGGGCNVGWTTPSEWLEYDLWVAAQEEFFATLRMASDFQGKAVHLEVDGKPRAGSMTAPSDGWQSYADRSVPLGELSPGAHTLRVVFDTGDVNLNYLDILDHAPPIPELPALLEAEHYVRFGEASSVNHGAVGSPECDRGDGVDLELTGDHLGGHCNVGWTQPGEWLQYDLWIPAALAPVPIEIVARLASMYAEKTVRIDVDGASLGALTAPSDGWQSYADRSLMTAALEAGSHSIRLTFETGDVNVNFLDVRANDSLLVSAYLRHDQEALRVAKGLETVTLPTENRMDGFGLQWRMSNVMRMLGFEPDGITTGEVINSERMLELDRALLIRERLFEASAALLPDYADISGPDFLDNIPQYFAAHQIVQLNRLLNSGGTRFMSNTNGCVLASFMPQMCGALVDMGTTDGSGCKSSSAQLREHQIIQMPEMFSFGNVRREITADEYPAVPRIWTTCAYVDVLLHEFVHDLDRRWEYSSGYMHKQYDRKEHCSPHFMDFNKPGTPFTYTGAAGAQNPDDFVSGYAAGLTNAYQDYRPWEDAAETVTTFVLYPEYFRGRLSNSEVLTQKYHYVREHLFGGAEFENPALDGNISFEFVDNTNVFCRDKAVTEFRLADIRARK